MGQEEHMKERPDFNKKVKDRLEGIRESVEVAREHLVDSAVDAFDKSEEAWRDAMALVKKYPEKAIGLALLVGAVVGALVGSSRRSRD